MVEKTDDPQVCILEMPFELIDQIYNSLSDMMMKKIVSFRKFGDEQASHDYFDMHVRLTRLLRDWETNSRSPF